MVIQDVPQGRAVCPICGTYISMWQIAGGKTLTLNDQLFHKSCLDEKTIAEIQKVASGRPC